MRKKPASARSLDRTLGMELIKLSRRQIGRTYVSSSGQVSHCFSIHPETLTKLSNVQPRLWAMLIVVDLTGYECARSVSKMAGKLATRQHVPASCSCPSARTLNRARLCHNNFAMAIFSPFFRTAFGPVTIAVKVFVQLG